MTLTYAEQTRPNSDAQPQPTDMSPMSLVWADTPIYPLKMKAFLHQPFVVKKHRATYLHYDFRLGWDGVMRSWALPDGPTLCAAERRKAVEVPDHSKEFMNFEGVIPAPRYGAGTVMLWDSGVWEPQPDCIDVDIALRDGFLRLILHGKKLNGRWTLSRAERDGSRRRKPAWHLIKELDVFARSRGDRSILEEEPNSSSSGRTLEEIARDWHNGRTRDERQRMLF